MVASWAVVGKDWKVNLAAVSERIGKVAVELVGNLTTLWTLRNTVGWPHGAKAAVLLSGTACTSLCPGDVSKCGFYHAVMKADLRISVKDYWRNRNP